MTILKSGGGVSIKQCQGKKKPWEPNAEIARYLFNDRTKGIANQRQMTHSKLSKLHEAIVPKIATK